MHDIDRPARVRSDRDEFCRQSGSTDAPFPDSTLVPAAGKDRGQRATGTDVSYKPLEMHLADPKKGVYMSEFVAPIGGDAYFFVNDVLLPEWSNPLFKGMGHLSEWVSYLLGHASGTKPDALSHDFYINNSGKAGVRVEPAD
jgi:hypothetical protein